MGNFALAVLKEFRSRVLLTPQLALEVFKMISRVLLTLASNFCLEVLKSSTFKTAICER